ncbi:MAG: ABC transporter ATP-binding protein [Rickettsiales bacterium]|nr:ABC transporter ATP-binding protein [Rickettsiales bacterium]
MYNFSEKKLYKPFSNDISKGEFIPFLKKILSADKAIFITAIIYGVIISILSLAAPISVQLLINSVSFTAMLQPILILGTILLILVSLYGLVSILQFQVTEIFQRRFFARMGYEVGMSILNAKHQSFVEANQTEMVNRFFETVTIQKTIPKLFSKSFTVILQSLTGLFLIACYHPFFLIFTFGIPLIIFLIWKSFAPQAIIHSFLESRRKYDLVGCLEDIAANHLIFKSREGREYAKFKINFLTGLYLKERKLHFGNLFAQVVLLFVLYAIATALLLILGGWLVLKGQLSLGQLVASELVISAILYNISNLGRDFESFYDLISSAEKLSQFQNIPAEENEGEIIPQQIEEIKFDKASYHYHNHDYQFNLHFFKGKNYLLFTNGYSTKKIIIEMLLGLRQTISGSINLNKININKFNKYDLRSCIAIIDNSALIEATIKEYLTFNRKDISLDYVMSILEKIGLAESILSIDEGLEARIIPSGWPFSESEKILLKVARALIHKPQIIIADEVLDMLEPKTREKVLYYLTKESQATFLYFSHRYDNLKSFDETILIEKTFSQHHLT